MAGTGIRGIGGGTLPGLPVDTGHLGRYRDIARLVLRYADAPAVRTAGLAPTPEATVEEVERGKPEALARDLEEMGPTFVKLGQLLSTRPDLLPQPYLDALSRLQEGVTPFPADEVAEVVQEELGVRLSKAFEAFEEGPVAAASLGQVHRAVLRDGRPVAVKVQRPGVLQSVRADLKVLGDLATFADRHTEAGRRYAFGALLAEFRRALMAEMDYRREAENLSAMADAMDSFDHLLVPRPLPDFTSRRVLTMDLVAGRSLAAVSPMARMETEGPLLLDELFRAYLEQALVHGMMHADPHPGNVFLTEDGRLALLDMGMILHLGESLRKDLLRLLLALAEGDGTEVARRAESLGRATTGWDREGFRREVGEMVVRAREVRTEGLEMGRLVMAVSRTAGERGLRPPPELSLIGKTLLNLDGIAALLDPDFDPTEAIRRHAMAVTRRRVLRLAGPGRAVAGLLEAKEFTEELPGRVNRALDAVGNNDLEVRVRVIDEARILTGLQQMANRITSGLVLAALIVGAALLMRVETEFTLLGYPVLAILFFLAAAFGGVALLWRIWRGDRKTRRETRQ